jgi:hypothetical protein
LQTTFEKIDVYRSRDPEKDHQAKFAREDEIGKKIMAFVEDLNAVIKKMQIDSEVLNQLEAKDNLTPDDKDKYE